MTALPAAFRVLTSPAETGAVTLCLPQDVQAEAWDFPGELFEERTWVVPRSRPDTTLLARAADAIAGATRPMIVAGGGVLYSAAEAALDAFATRFGIPVAETQAGKGALPWDHPLQLGPVGVTGGSAANAVARDADVVIAIGTRLSDFTTASLDSVAGPGRALRGHQRRGAGRGQGARDPAAWPMPASCLGGADRGPRGTRLSRASPPPARRGPSGFDGPGTARSTGSARCPRPQHISQPEAIRLVNEAAGRDGVVVCAAGSLPGDLHKLWRTSRPGGYHLEYGYSTMGYEVAGGIGVAMAEPDRRVYVMVGDGSWLMMSAEIATAVQEGIGADRRAARQPRVPLHPQPVRDRAAARAPSRISGSVIRPPAS